MSTQAVFDTSAVFAEFQKLQQSGGQLDGAKLIGAELVYNTMQLDDPRHRVTLDGDADYVLRIASDILGEGKLQTLPKERTFADPVRRGTKTGAIIRSRRDSEDKSPRVIAFYEKAGNRLGVEFNFSVPTEGLYTDTLHVYGLGKAQTEVLHAFETNAYAEKRAASWATGNDRGDFGMSLVISSAANIEDRWQQLVTESRNGILSFQSRGGEPQGAPSARIG